MQKYLKRTGYVLLILLFFGGVFFYMFGIEPVDKKAYVAKSNLPDQPQRKTTAPLPDVKPTKTDILKKTKDKIVLKKRPIEKPAESKKEYPKYIEEIKQQIYDRQIESVDQIPLLDELVQTEDKDVRQFWGDGWSSVDDWKKEENGFKLEKKDDGSMMFNPDAATARKYTFFETPKSYKYDPEHKEFVNEVDYYGKTIYNVAKFINDDVLVMMTISGSKVDLNIYQKDAGQLTSSRDSRQLPSGPGASGLTR